ncbi:hypothetical protein [Nonomuraea wenchangensis]|uniref:Uncharacterized protein n=1 Tax=Nonomuraea wenchangensis TaxID=568860 RepID=A0A1I0F2W6_9ACTN|nr:hypothetical protein [Nonomuraea wenchangensis]SET52147.1 hypothetical protein SAMN05421811_103297 [Nonomuraea wenchangensis]
MKWFLGVIGAALATWLVVVLIGWLTQPVRTANGVRERVGDPDNVLYQYEHFHDLCASVAATDVKIAAKQGEIAAYDKRHPDGDPSDRFQAAPKRDRLDTELTGLQQFRADQAAKYNADSAKANRSLFKDRDLPAEIGDDTPDCN